MKSAKRGSKRDQTLLDGSIFWPGSGAMLVAKRVHPLFQNCHHDNQNVNASTVMSTAQS